jgi:hypothetical protein
MNGSHRITGKDLRGGAADRRARRRWIIARFGSPSGKTIKCFWCPKLMRTSTPTHPLGVFEIDRWPVCGHEGGTYRRGNIVPACAQCNATRCSKKGCRKVPRKRSSGYGKWMMEQPYGYDSRAR